MGITDKRTPAGKALYSCDGPGCKVSDAPWDDKWIWYGSYKDVENDRSAVLTFCTKGCARRYSETTEHTVRAVPPPDEVA